jgi:hypothetical protein
MSHFAYYAEPPAAFEGFGGSVVPARIVYNGFGEPVGALPLIPLITALAPLAAQLVGNLFKGGSGLGEIDGYGFGESEGMGLYAGSEVVPAQIVHNRLGETVGAFPLVAALAPLAAKAAGMIAPFAAKAASAVVPLVTKAATSIVPALGPPADMPAPPPSSAAAPIGPDPAAPIVPPPAAPGIPPAPAMWPAASVPPPGYPVRRRPRRHHRFVRRRMRMGPPGAPQAYAPMRPMPPVPPPPAPVATDASGGMHGFYGYAY